MKHWWSLRRSLVVRRAPKDPMVATIIFLDLVFGWQVVEFAVGLYMDRPMRSGFMQARIGTT